MVEVREPQLELRRLRRRLLGIMILMLACFGLLAGRLVWLQVYKYADLAGRAESNRIGVVPLPAPRGRIFDRHGVLLAENLAFNTIEVSRREVGHLDWTLDEIARLVEITPAERRRFNRLIADSRNAEWIPLKIRISDQEAARIAVNRFRLPGVDVRSRDHRNYPFGESAAHVIGYIGRISPEDKRRLDEAGLAAEYTGYTHLGKTGIEQHYEAALHGRTGYDEVEVSAAGRGVRTLSHYPAEPGSDLVLSIDIRLQQLIEEWFGKRRGALVALDPATGEVLAMVSKPAFDPNLFVDGIDTQSWSALNTNPDSPMLNRPLRGTYPPGSTYKPFMALALLHTGVRTPQQRYEDPGYFELGKHRFRDSRPGGHGVVDLHKSIVVSSDTYYYAAAMDLGVDRIHDYMRPWGFGAPTGIDLSHESAGILPSTSWKRKRHGKGWLPGETPSIGIGQGYNAFTILQLAHATATLANRGVVMRPRLVQRVLPPEGPAVTPLESEPARKIPIRPDHLELVRSAMVEVNRQGTARFVFADAPYVAAGKTGTSQVIGIAQNAKYDADRIAERHRDHSLYMGFAPAEQPRIALAVIVENGGFGAAAAAPIARRVFDYVLLGQIPTDTPLDLQRRLEALSESDLRDVPETIGPELLEDDEPGPTVATPPSTVKR